MDEDKLNDDLDRAFRAGENKIIFFLTDDYRRVREFIDEYVYRLNNRQIVRDMRVRKFLDLGYSLRDLQKIFKIDSKSLPTALKSLQKRFTSKEDEEIVVKEHVTYDASRPASKIFKEIITNIKKVVDDSKPQTSMDNDEEVELGINVIDIFPWLKKELIQGYNTKNILNEIYDLYTKYSAWSAIVIIEPLDFDVPEDMKNFSTVIRTQLPTVKQFSREVKVINEFYVQFEQDDGLPFSQEVKMAGSKCLTLTEPQQLVVCRNAIGLSINKFKEVLNHLYDYCSLHNKGYDYFIAEVAKQKSKVMATSSVFEFMKALPISQVGGLDVLKEYITKQKNTYSDEAKKFGVGKFKGILLAGSPGSGKSLSAKAISSILEKPLIKMDLSSVFDKYVGGSESKIRRALDALESISPVVVLVDEVDKILGNSTNGDSNVTARVLGSILTFMQETKKEITWVFTANRVENLPPELLRKGRLDEIFYVEMPNAVEREVIFKIHLQNKNQPFDKIDFTEIITKSDGASGAEIEQVVQESVLNKFIENGSDSESTVNEEDILKALSQLKKQVDMFPQEYEDMCSWGEANGRKASSRKVKKKTIKTRKKSLSKIGS